MPAVLEPPHQRGPHRATQGGRELLAVRFGQVGRSHLQSPPDVGVDLLPERRHHGSAATKEQIRLCEDPMLGEVVEQAGHEAEAVTLPGRRHNLGSPQEGVSQQGVEVLVVQVERRA